MKLQTKLQKGSNADRLSISGNILSVNSVEYDLSSVDKKIDLIPTDNFDQDNPEYKNIEEYKNQKIWSEESGEIRGLLMIGIYHQIAWVNKNMMNMFGFSDGDITIKELTKYIKWHNQIQDILDEYSGRIKELKEAEDTSVLNKVYAERDGKISDINKSWLAKK